LASEEGLELLQLQLKHLLSLRVMTVIGEMPVGLLMVLLRRALNITTLAIDSDSNMEGLPFLKKLFINKLTI
jgi:hypothetical protein